MLYNVLYGGYKYVAWWCSCYKGCVYDVVCFWWVQIIVLSNIDLNSLWFFDLLTAVGRLFQSEMLLGKNIFFDIASFCVGTMMPCVLCELDSLSLSYRYMGSCVLSILYSASHVSLSMCTFNGHPSIRLREGPSLSYLRRPSTNLVHAFMTLCNLSKYLLFMERTINNP